MNACQRITRQSASNLALAFIVLPKAKRASMTALYAFCRQIDDVADEDQLPVEQRRDALRDWRNDIHAACQQDGRPRFRVTQELQPVIQRYQLPVVLFDELIQGVSMDLEHRRYPSYADLEQYCYRVASVVGLLSIEIFGYQDPRCREYAVHLGQALQLTNILRDVHQDALRGRIYLPQDCLQRHHVTETDLVKGRYSPAYRSLAAEVAERARGYYQMARRTLPVPERRSMIAAELMGSVYWELLRKLESVQFNVFGPHRIRLAKWHKLILILRTWWNHRFGSGEPRYGGS
jgi:15-cis-phytoene synthase